MIQTCKTVLIRLICAALAAAMLEALLPETERGARKVIMLAVMLAVLSGVPQ